MPKQLLCLPHSWELADSPALREEVYSFRYRHYFNHLPEAEWLDHGRGRVFAPHDEHSVHLVARNADGAMIAVGTGTRADVCDLPEEWVKMLQVARLQPLEPAKILISSRLVELPACRGSSLLFLHFFKFAARYYVSRGVGYTIHYAPPAFVPLYERLGYRRYGYGFTLHSGLYRIPMILVVPDAAYLARVHPAFREAIRGLVPAGDAALAYRLLPELATVPLAVRSAPDALQHARALYRGGDAERAIPDEAARPVQRSSLLHLRKGDAPIHPGDAPLFWFLLSGSCTVRHHDGGSQCAMEGYGINSHAGCCFVALEDTDVLVFSSRAPGGGLESVAPASHFWQALLAAQQRQRS